MELQVFASTTDHTVGGGKTLWRLGSSLSVGGPSLTLTKIEYDRRVSAPGELLLHFDVTASDKKISQILLDNLIKTECLVSLYTSNSFCIAENYYVAGIRLTASEENKYVGVLKCCSYDYHLTEQKYCEAFTGKTFGTEVFHERLKGRQMKVAPGKNAVPFPYLFNIGRLLFLAFNKDKKYRTDVRDTEVIQPYLVQYNESLYDFLNRVAHRCGEFLYFEDGKLQLGLPDGTVKFLSGDKSGLQKFTGKSPLCSYADIGGESESGTLFAADYSKKSNDRNNTAPSGTMFDMEYSSDEYLKIISAGDDSKKDTLGWWIMFKALCTLFTGDDQVQSIASAMTAALFDIIYSKAILPAALRSSYKELHIEASDRPKASAMAPVDNGGLVYNICNHFYQLVERLEKNAERDTVRMCFSDNFQKLRLGEAVDLDDGRFTAYVITRLYGSFTYKGTSMSENHYGEGVPVYAGAGQSNMLDALKRVAVPPRGDIPHIIKSDPLEAVVSANADPLRMGRVRVRFPWQDGAHKDASPWIRVTVPFAGTASGSSGFTMTPDVGEHVMLNFVDGNIERPFVDGSLYHISDLPGLGVFENTPFNAGTDYKTRSIVSGNGHNITFKDKPDTNLLSTTLPFVQPVMQVMSNIPFVRKAPEFFNSNSLTGVKGGGVTISDGSFQCSLSIDAGKRAINISSDMGTVAISAFTGITVNAPNGDITIKGKNVSIEAGNNLSLKSGTNIRDKANYADRFVAGISSSFASFTTSAIFNHLGINLQGTFDCSYLRHLWEILFRPVEGTLSISSKRNVTVTAGKGKVMVPSSLLSKAEVPRIKPDDPEKRRFYVPYKDSKFDFSLLSVLSTKVNKIKQFIDTLYDTKESLDDQLRSMIDSFAKLGFEDDEKKQYNSAFESLLRSVADTAADIKKIVPEGQDEKRNVKRWYNIKYLHNYNKFIKDYKKFLDLGEMDNIFNSEEDGNHKIDVEEFKKRFRAWYFIEDSKKPIYYGKNPKLIANSEYTLRMVQRSVVVFYLVPNKFVRIYKPEKDSKSHFGNSLHNDGYMKQIKLDDAVEYWNEFLEAVHLVKEKEKEQYDAFRGAWANAFGFASYDMDTKQISSKFTKLSNTNGAAGPRAWNEISGSGNILMSSMPDTTVKIGTDGKAWAFDRNLDGTLLSEYLKNLGLN